MGGGGSFIRTGFWETGGFWDDPRFCPNKFDKMLMDCAWPGFFSAGTTFGGGGLGGGAFLTGGAAETLLNGVSSQLVAGLYRLGSLLDACGGGGAGRDGIVIFLLIWQQTGYCDDGDDDDGGVDDDDDEGNPTTHSCNSG